MLGLYKSELEKQSNSFYPAEYVTSLKEAEEILDRYEAQLDHQKRGYIGGMYKIIGMNNWEDNELYNNFKEALLRLKQLRRSGGQHTIIVNAKTLRNV